MAKMNPVHSSVQQPIDGGTERRGLSGLVVATLAIAIFVIGAAFYSFSSSPPTAATSYSPVADAFKALESSQSIPPTTTGQGSR